MPSKSSFWLIIIALTGAFGVAYGQGFTRKTYHDPEKKKIKEVYQVKDTVRNVAHGRYTSYFVNGGVESKGQFENNETTGVWEFFYETGKLKMRGILFKSANYGMWEYFYEGSGQKNMEDIINGKNREGEWKSYYENGHVKEVGGYKENRHIGLWKSYFEDGALKGEIVYTDDTGYYTEYYHSGKPQSEGTRYQYQLVWQSTPDAGESHFWYNGLGQLRLSQNSQQYKDTLYSYSRYDEQGRIVEVGEMATADSLHTLLARLDSLSFPQAESYTLTDITRTHYDFIRPGLPADFEQQHLRTRVSWVEILEKYQTDTISTTYSYDVHGNVKSLLQDIPGLSPKRTDYVYDLVSGKVNYVLYQFTQSDQFIHRYGYDDDNRITDVHTSSDGFIWDHDARYYYYKHGPLARTELGEYRVQGLDCYYTLQGWIKGVNIPYQDDPAVGNVLDEGVGKDVFSYALGYYQGDYKPVAPGLVPPDTRDNLWTRQQEMHGHTGLYNGNISWMITDLAKLGEVAGSRAKGMQAMLYKYDQLHRLVKSRSLTQYDPTGGFASRSQSPGAYDENYTYDPNGNIQTLLRHNETGGVMDDFNYGYYAHSNKLREVKPVTKTKEYTSGPIRTDNIVYRNVKIRGTAHVPAGSTVEVKALDDIFMDPDFQAHEESDFWAHIVKDEGTYQYNAIGNLIADQDEGVRIRWTPYGKMRDVHTRGDSLVVAFRYDAFGNRIERMVTTRRDSAKGVRITRYVRDVKGNVLAVHSADTIAEAFLYGNGRIGRHDMGREEGYRRLGGRQFELSNHLGNVLSLVADNVRINLDTVEADVVSCGDYYPFGLEISGRQYSDSIAIYRYAFNGKEINLSGELGGVSYDYGFRIYNAKLGRFLSVDPLSDEFPWWSVYHFAGNTPIIAADLDGAEPIYKVEFEGSYDATLNNIDFDYTLAYLFLSWKASGHNAIRNSAEQVKAGRYAPVIIWDKVSIKSTPDGIPYLYEETVVQDRFTATIELAFDVSSLSSGKGSGPTGGLLAKSPGKAALGGAMADELGRLREIAVAKMVSGRVTRIGKSKDIVLYFTRKDGSKGGVTVDVIGESGELIVVGGFSKSKKLTDLGDRLANLALAAKERGVKAMAYFTDDTPESALNVAKKWLGEENVKLFKDVKVE